LSKSPKRTNELRLAAEARLDEIAASRETNGNALDQTKLIHELQVHQIEMEMQGESLKQAQPRLKPPTIVTSTSMNFPRSAT
jgi:hypothetical protein